MCVCKMLAQSRHSPVDTVMDKQKSAGFLQGFVFWHSVRACVYIAVWGTCVSMCVCACGSIYAGMWFLDRQQ